MEKLHDLRKGRDEICHDWLSCEMPSPPPPHGCRTCIKRELILHGNFFYFRGQKCIYEIGLQEIKIRPSGDFEGKILVHAKDPRILGS